MTPKEKGEELVNKFMNLNLEKTKLADYSRIYYPTAKQCALIAVDEIIENGIKWVPEIDWWMQVKKEIELF